MNKPPVGTVTFLFTDIEGSTKLWQQYPGAMPEALNRHHASLRESITAHNGYIFQIIGDAFCAAFSTVNDGLSAALQAQRLLATEKWGETGAIRVRMALHTDRAEVKAGDYTSGEYVSGLALSRAARLLSAGHGGQILLSLAATELVRDQLAPDVCLRDLGEQRLKDLERPEHIFQLVVPDLPADFPPLKTLESYLNNLPLQLTSFIGREKEIIEVKQMLGSGRLLTLTGPGGTGKTRLALQVGADMLDQFSDGVWLVEFAPITNPELIPHAVANVLGVREEKGTPLFQTISTSLRPKSLLLILDNCEHLIENMALFVEKLLRACPKVQILASSREILGIAGEISFRVPSLSVPPTPAPGAGGKEPQFLSQYEAVRLFIERAAAVKPEFQMTCANSSALAQICQRLDGIPLAIELAAARVKAMSLEQIAERIDDRFCLLTGGSRTALPRHQTLRALIDWSYDLLTPIEQTLINRLAVFMGGWNLETAEAVCNDSQSLPTKDVLDTLVRLVDKSLVTLDELDGETRYQMLETIRQYARDKLLDSGESERLHTKHLDYFLAFAQQLNEKLHGPEELAALKQYELDLDNFRLALDWSLGVGRVEKGLRLVGALWGFWNIQGYWQEGYARAQSLLTHSEAAPRNLSRAVGLLAAAELCQDHLASRVCLEEFVPLARELGKAGQSLLALGLGAMSWIIYIEEPVKAEVMLEEGLALAVSLNQPWIIAHLLRKKGWFLLGRRDFSASCQAFEESLALCRVCGDRRMAALSLRGAAGVRFIEHDFTTPIQQFQEVIQIFRDLNDKPYLISTLYMLSEMERAIGRYDLAKIHCQEASGICRELGIRNSSLPFGLACIAIHENDLVTARTHISEGLELAQELHLLNELAFAMLVYGGIFAKEKKAQQAVELLSFFNTYFESGDKRYFTPTDEMDFDCYLALAREQLDQAAFEAAWENGKAMTMEEAIKLATI